MIALVDGAVVEATPIDTSMLRPLALFLCEVEEFCLKVERPLDDREARNRREDRWERERQENGGFCNECRNQAGRILAKFDVKEKA